MRLRRDDAPDDLVECPDCRTALHADCAASLERCPTVGCRGRLPAMDQAQGLVTFLLDHLGRSRAAVVLLFLWLVLGWLGVQVALASVLPSRAPPETIIDFDSKGREVVRRHDGRPPLTAAAPLLGGAAAAFAAHAALAVRARRSGRRPAPATGKGPPG